MLSIEESVFGDVTVLSCKGMITFAAGDVVLRHTLSRHIEQGHKKFILDLAGVPYIDSAGLSVAGWAYTMATRQSGRVVFCNLTERILAVFSITKLLSVLEIYESVDDALASFEAARFEVSCPLCRPTMWTSYLPSRFLLTCIQCDARFSPRVAANMLASLETASADQTSGVVSASVSDLWWFTYYENGYGQEGVHLTLGKPSVVAITGRLDLFALDIVQLAWEAVPAPRRVVFDTTHVRISSPAGRARLEQLCAAGDGSSRSVILTTVEHRDRAIAALGDLQGAAQAIDVAIRRRG